jgi:glucosyl-3-phosphoglycerate synthase
VQPEVTDWFARRTTAAADWPIGDLYRAKLDSGLSVAVVLPALDEQSTIGAIVAAVRDRLTVEVALVDEIVVVDSGSTDGTAATATAAGGRVVSAAGVLPEFGPAVGKGDAMWRALAATDADIVAFVDADLEHFRPEVVSGLLGPLLCDRAVHLVKGAYDRPLRAGQAVLPAGGGRVTELVARPLLNLHWPQLAGVVQPLAGEWAARRDLLQTLWFPAGYGVEIAVLIDTLRTVGLDGIAQVDLGARHHRHQDDAALGRMAAQVWHAMLARMPGVDVIGPDVLGGDLVGPTAPLTDFRRQGGRLRPRTQDVELGERPPLTAVLTERRRPTPCGAAQPRS